MTTYSPPLESTPEPKSRPLEDSVKSLERKLQSMQSQIDAQNVVITSMQREMAVLRDPEIIADSVKRWIAESLLRNTKL